MKTKNKQDKPKWFKGMWYDNGETVANPFTGDKCELTGAELSMYDFIKGAEYTISVTYNDDILHPDVARLSNEMRKALDWYRKANDRAYLILLD